MVQTLNLILLTASELSDLRATLATAFEKRQVSSSKLLLTGRTRVQNPDGIKVFQSLFQCWCHNPMSTFSLCLLSRAYDVSFALIKRFSEMEVTVSLLMQVDKLVQLLESPIFVHMRLQLLDVDSRFHAPLLKSLYGLLMLLPQSDAFRSLNDRLITVCNLRENLGVAPTIAPDEETPLVVSKKIMNVDTLMKRFDTVMEMHRRANNNVIEMRGQARVGQASQNSEYFEDMGESSSQQGSSVQSDGKMNPNSNVGDQKGQSPGGRRPFVSRIGRLRQSEGRGEIPNKSK